MRLNVNGYGKTAASHIGGYQIPESGSARNGYPERIVGFQSGI
jgi:hypothetical protein